MENLNKGAVETTANNNLNDELAGATIPSKADVFRNNLMVKSKAERFGKVFTNFPFIVLGKTVRQITDKDGKESFYSELLLGYGDGTETLSITGSEYLADCFELYTKYDIGFNIDVSKGYPRLKIASAVKAKS